MAVAGIRLRCSAFGRLTACGLLSWALLGSAERASAQVFTVLNSFEGGPGPSSLIQGLDGNSWGTTSQGGTNDRGSVFKVAPDGTLTTVYSFTGTDGAYPGALVQASDRNFYGATSGGGAFGSGAIFRVSAAGVLTTLYSFSGADGSSPNGTLFLAADGNLYGTTQGGGANGLGTFFAITPGGALTSLHSIAPGEGLYPQGPLTQGSDGSLYGTASAGGTSGLGVVFKVTTAGSWTTLYSFAGTDGSGPAGGVAAGSDGNFYGVASAGGANGGGTVFRITPSGVLTTLYSFAGSDGLTPSGGVTLAADGNFYGTTYVGGASYGTVFRITPSGVLTTLAVFNPGTGFWPRSNLVQESDGNFYGTTSNGGGFGKGTVFAIKTDGTLTTVASFPGPVQGAGADSGIVQAADGSFYGETYLGGVYGLGTVYRLTPAGVLTILHSFAGGSEGALGFNALVQGSDGNFYGSTEAGGTSNKGTIFTMTPAGGFTTLYTFTGPDGATPQSALVQGADGNFYGTTIGGGANGKGTAFVITPAGILTTLHSFNGPGDGRSPYAPLLLASDGNFYGATRGGGSGAKGTLFRMTPAGALTTLYAFAGADGQNPVQALVQAADGNLYGTTYVGGLSGLGTVFRITPSGTLATLYSFSGSDGRNPIAGLSIGSDGNFYGTTEFGGTADLGTIFRITPTGTLTTLFSFSTPVGTDPFGGVIQGRDGNFYGTANWGGPLNGGVVYRLVLGAGPAPAITGVSPANGPMAGGTALTISGSDFQPGVTVTIGGIPATNVTFISATTIRAFTPASASSGAVAVAVLNPDGQSRTLPSAFTYGCVSAPVAVASGDATICAGGAAGGTVLVGSGGASCSWSPATDLSNPNDCRPAATPAATTTYTLTVTDVNGCVSANAPTVTVTVAPCANLSIAASAPSSVIAGNQVAVTVTVTNVVPKTGAADAVGVTVGSAAPPAGFTFVSNTGDCTTGFPCALGTLPVGATRTIVTTFATTNPFPAPPGPAYVSALFNVSSTTMDPYALDNSTQAWIFVLPAGSPLTGIWPLPLGACQSYGALEPAPGGTLYGTTFAGGGYGAGTTFSFDPTSGSVNALGSFSGAEGANPQIGLTRASDGKFYGTAPVGLRGGATFGAVYRFDPAGKTPLVALYAFNGSDGWSPIGRLIQAADGLLYGTTYRGGTTDQGTIFRVDPATGTFTPLFSFSGANGRNPQAGLIQASDGFFYGTTYFGGSSDQGTVYRFDSASGTVTPLVQFTGANGRQPFIGGLMQASDGNLYGTTLYGGTNDNGTIFRVALPAGALTTIHSFNDTDGREPHAALIQAADGLLYGAAEIGTPTGGGAIFRIHPVSLTYQVLYQFAGLEGKFPRGALIWSADGSLYGTTSYGGTNNCGSVYQLVPPPLPVVATATVSGGGTICAGGSATIQAALTGAAPFSVTWSDDVTQSGVMTSTVTRTVSPVATTAYTVTSMSDASGPGGSTGAATVSVNPLPAASPIPGATLGKPYSTVLAATAGSPPYTFSVSGALPAGLTFTGATATITGTPTASGAFPLAILVADAKGCSSSTPQTLVVCAPITVSPATLSAGSTGVATSRTLTAAGGTAPYAFAITSGALPAGLTLSPAGVITGNALQTGTFTFTVTATDANGCTGSRAYTWTLNCPALSLNPTTFAGVTIGDPLARTLTTTNAAGAVAYAVTSGALPAGLTLDGEPDRRDALGERDVHVHDHGDGRSGLQRESRVHLDRELPGAHAQSCLVRGRAGGSHPVAAAEPRWRTGPPGDVYGHLRCAAARPRDRLEPDHRNADRNGRLQLHNRRDRRRRLHDVEDVHVERDLSGDHGQSRDRGGRHGRRRAESGAGDRGRRRAGLTHAHRGSGVAHAFRQEPRRDAAGGRKCHVHGHGDGREQLHGLPELHARRELPCDHGHDDDARARPEGLCVFEGARGVRRQEPVDVRRHGRHAAVGPDAFGIGSPLGDSGRRRFVPVHGRRDRRERLLERRARADARRRLARREQPQPRHGDGRHVLQQDLHAVGRPHTGRVHDRGRGISGGAFPRAVRLPVGNADAGRHLPLHGRGDRLGRACRDARILADRRVLHVLAGRRAARGCHARQVIQSGPHAERRRRPGALPDDGRQPAAGDLDIREQARGDADGERDILVHSHGDRRGRLYGQP